MEKMKMHSPNLTQGNIARIRELFPNCVTEVQDENRTLRLAVDFDLLRQELSESIIEGPRERYHFNWPGKREALLTANAPISKTLRPCREESVNFDTTKNIFIEGDNLDALKLLQETYLGKVKMIYIDPPYNTGHDFIYKDDFAESSDEFLKRSNQKDEEGNRLVANTESNGRFHSDWLSMMYSRLKLARNLLRDDGVIFISIDDNEVTNLRKLCDEFFGEENFFESIIWNKRIPKNDEGIGSIHEYILIYVKNKTIEHRFTMPKDGIDEIEILLKKLKDKNIPIPQSENEVRELYSRKGYDRGITLYNSLDSDYKLWGKINVSWPNAETNGPRYEVFHPKTKKPVKIPERGWRWKKETFDELLDYKNCIELHNGTYVCGKIWFDKDEKTQPSLVKHLNDVERMLLRSIVSLKSDGGITVELLFGNKSYYSYPKPVSLVELLIQSIEMKSDDIILDFFAGSSTTAHAVMQLNAEDGGNRKFIMVQLPESCCETSEAFKAGFKTIAEISKERIRRAGKKILEGKCHETWNKDIGFRVFKIDSSNMEEVYYTPDAIDQESLGFLYNNIKQGRTAEDQLFQVLLDWGVDLSLPIRKETIRSKSVFFVDENALVACFDKGVDEELVKELATFKPMRVVFRDTGFASDSVKINVEQIFKQMSPSTEVKSI